MSDTLGTFNLLPVTMVDGQTPTSKLFNAAFGQIETAFELLSQVIGDFDATGEGEVTYVPSLIRAFGNMGWINCRLPANLRVPVGEGGGTGDDLPFILEDLDENFLGKKEACLTFLPAVTSAAHADIIDVNLGTGVVTGTPVTQNLGVAGRFVLDGKRVLTSTAIIAGATIQYPIDTGADNFRDSYGPETGANVVPSVPQIFSGTAALCTITQPEGYQANEYRIDFPPVTRIMNPQVPFSTEEGLDAATDIIQLDANGASPVRWSGTAPKYPIPEKLLNLATGTLLPYNMVSLWFHNGTAVTRVRATLTNDQFRWDTIPGTLSAVKLTVPAGFALPANPGDEGDDHYIVGFAGTSVADALLHERARTLLHSHDGNDGTPIEALDLFERFNPSHWFHSTKAYNHFPQYLERGGLNGDTLNRQNAMLGVLHLGPTSATESNTSTASSVGSDSWPLSFGHISLGPSFFVNASDTVLESGTSGKLNLTNTGLRINEGNFFLGLEDGQEIGFDLDAAAVPHPILDLRKYSGSANVGYATLQLGQLYVTGGQIGFDNRSEAEAPNITYGTEGDLFVWNILADGVIDNTRLRVGGVETNSINAESSGSVFFPVRPKDFEPYHGETDVGTTEPFQMGYDGGDLSVDDVTRGETNGVWGKLLLKAPFGASPRSATSPSFGFYWQVEETEDSEDQLRDKFLVAKIDFPALLSRTRLNDAELEFDFNLTGATAHFRALDSNMVIAGKETSLWLRIFRVNRNGDPFSLSGIVGNVETVYTNEGDDTILGAGPRPEYVEVDLDGDSVGSHPVNFDYDYYVFIGFQATVNCDFLGVDLTFETNLVA